jgi:hypothetical protein
LNHSFGQQPKVFIHPIIDAECIRHADSLLDLGKYTNAINAYSVVIALSLQKQYPWPG